MNEENSNEELGADGEQGAFITPSMEELGTLLPQYEFHSLIGMGGMGAVYLARQITLDRPVAIKVMPPVYEDQAAEAEQFIGEARAMARLVHPHIVAVYDFGQTPAGHLFLVMEYIEGTDLHRMIRAGSIDATLAHQIVGQLCDALQFAHDHGVAHRDIKPANIFVTRDHQVKVGDFGLARNLADLATDDDGMGTPDYASPERLVVGAKVDHRADIYSLGVVIHEMLSGETPRQAAKHGGAKLPAAFVGVMSKCLMVDPARRYQSAREVKAALAAARQSQKKAPPPVHSQRPNVARAPVPMSARPVARQSPATSGFGGIGWALACLMVVAGLGWLIWKNQNLPADASAAQTSSTTANPTASPVAPGESNPSEAAPSALGSGAMPSTLPAAFTTPLTPPFVMADGEHGVVKTMMGHGTFVRSLVMLPDQRRILSSSGDGTMRVWDVADGRELGKIAGGSQVPQTLLLSPDGTRVAGYGGNSIVLCDLRDGSVRRSAPFDAKFAKPLLFSPDGVSLIITSGNLEKKLWKWTPSGGTAPVAMTGWNYTVRTMQSVQGGRFVTMGFDIEDRKYSKMEARTGSWDSLQPVAELSSVKFVGFNSAVSPDGRTLAYGFDFVRLYDVLDDKVLTTFRENAYSVNATVFLDGGRLLLTGSSDRNLRIWDCASGGVLSKSTTEHGVLNTIVVSKDERWAVSAGSTAPAPNGTAASTQPAKRDPAAFALYVWRLPKLETLGDPASRSAFTARQLANLETADPELAHLKSAAEAEAKIATVEQMAAQIADLNGKYIAALKRDAVNAAPVEQKAMLEEASGIAGGMFIDPAVDDATLPATLRNKRAIYRQQMLVIETSRNETAARATAELSAKLKPLLEAREAAGDKAGAARVRAVISGGVQPVKIADLFGAFGAATVPTAAN